MKDGLLGKAGQSCTPAMVENPGSKNILASRSIYGPSISSMPTKDGRLGMPGRYYFADPEQELDLNKESMPHKFPICYGRENCSIIDALFW
jgi:hypothetical protein